VCVGAGGGLVGVDDAAFTSDEVEAPPELVLDEWLELLPPHALNIAAETTNSAISRSATSHLAAVAIVRQVAYRLRTRRR
jgi:hypothetical protein